MNMTKPVANKKTQKALLLKIMEADFALNEMVLYLDTHPQCQKALALYQKYAEKAKELKEYYTKTFGPLTPDNNLSDTCWQWANGPWPWEKDC